MSLLFDYGEVKNRHRILTVSELISLCSTGLVSRVWRFRRCGRSMEQLRDLPERKRPFVPLWTNKTVTTRMFFFFCAPASLTAAPTLTCAIRMTRQHQRIRPITYRCWRKKDPEHIGARWSILLTDGLDRETPPTPGHDVLGKKI